MSTAALDPNGPESHALPRRTVYIVFAALLAAMLLSALDQSIVGTALPTIVGDLGAAEGMGWVITAYLLAIAIVMPIYGKLGDLVIWDAPDLDRICYRVGSNLAKTVIKRGEIV